VWLDSIVITWWKYIQNYFEFFNAIMHNDPFVIIIYHNWYVQEKIVSNELVKLYSQIGTTIQHRKCRWQSFHFPLVVSFPTNINTYMGFSHSNPLKYISFIIQRHNVLSCYRKHSNDAHFHSVLLKQVAPNIVVSPSLPFA
jgi:hypothetical protein